jgi:cell wall-associated NlpC family hydrolase
MKNITKTRTNKSRKIYKSLSYILLLSALSACSPVKTTYNLNITDITGQQLNAQYWKNKLQNNETMSMKSQDIAAFNQQLFESDPHVVRPLASLENLDKTALIEKINDISSIPTSARFYADGTELTPQNFARYRDNLNIQDVKDNNIVQFGLVTKRSALRTFPTLDRVFNQEMDLDLDRFQETGVFPSEAVAILHTSKDGKWLLVQNYNYLAWVQRDDIAIGDKQEIQAYLDHDDFLLVSGAKVHTSYVPNEPKISQIQLDMGVKLPLLSSTEQHNELYGQSTAGSYQVKLPVRNQDGSLSIKTALIGRTQDVHEGYLEYTPENVIAQAYKFLGERYGWGHDYDGRDCTGFVGEIYKTFGILMPRNSGQQGNGKYGTNFRFDEHSDPASKLAVIKKLQIGDLIYIPGHVMVYLGKENNQPIVIHDVKGLAYWTPEGQFVEGVLNAVSVTPLITLQLNETTTYLDKIYNIKRLTLNNVEGH